MYGHIYIETFMAFKNLHELSPVQYMQIENNIIEHRVNKFYAQ